LLAALPILCVTLYGQGTGSEGSKLVEKLGFDEITWDVPKLGVDVIVDTLPNGMVLFMMEDHRLPMVNVRGLIRTGNMYDPIGKEGLADLTARIMRVGGTESLGPDELNEELEYIAASIEVWINDEAGGARLNCLSKDIDKGLELLADVLMRPAFRQEKVDLEKEKIRESIRRRNDSPGSICSREFNHVIYGNHHYGSILEWETVENITRDDLIRFHSEFFVPNNIWLGITGDFDIDDIKARLRGLFDGWSAVEVDFPDAPAVKREFKPGVYLIDKDITQSHINFGILGANMYTPDRFAVSIMNQILGGGSFTSRMMTEVRSNMGLAYSVGSRFATNSRDIGTFRAYCQTKTETTCKAIGEMVNQIRGMREKQVSDYELESAKDSYTNRFVFRFTDPASIVNRLMNLEYDGMPRDFYETYLDNVRAVTKEDVLRVAKEYLRVESMTFLVVGNASALETPLGEFGKVTKLELEDPVVD
jgi:predicted Zn-dependent peptidase